MPPPLRGTGAVPEGAGDGRDDATDRGPPSAPRDHETDGILVDSPVLLSLLLLAFGPAAPHVPPPIQVSVDVPPDGRPTARVALWSSIYRDWTGREAEADAARPPGEVQAVAAPLLEALSRRLRFKVDGEEVAPALVTLEFVPGHETTDFVPYAALTLDLGGLDRPRRVSLTALDFDDVLLAGAEARVPVAMDPHLDFEVEHAILTTEEPEQVFHVPGERPRPVTSWTPPPADPRPSLPLLSLLILLAAPLCLRCVPRRRVPRLLAATLLLVLAAMAWPLVHVPLGTAETPPEPSEALARFEELHRGVYRAFDQERPVAIHDALEQVAAPDLLDGLYAEVYESLVMRDENGAVGRVRTLRLLEMELDYPESADRLAYDVRARFRVEGEVVHHGHRHLRVNTYEGVYTVGPVADGAWKLQAVRMLSSDRDTVDGALPVGG